MKTAKGEIKNKSGKEKSRRRDLIEIKKPSELK